MMFASDHLKHFLYLLEPGLELNFLIIKMHKRQVEMSHAQKCHKMAHAAAIVTK